MREELKIDACPFCGGEGEDDCVNAVHCACGAAMQVPYTGQKTSRKAITAWNTRAKPPPPADDNHKALVEALRSSEHRQPINPKAVYRTRDVALFEEAANALERLAPFTKETDHG